MTLQRYKTPAPRLGTLRIHPPLFIDMHIQAARMQDMPRIQALYAEAIAFQRDGGHPHWQNVDFAVVEHDIALGHQFTLIQDHQIAGIFSLCPPSPMDEDLWRGRDPASARYINRTIAGRQWRGRQLFSSMLAWCEREVARQDIALLRLDTWAENTALIRYYGQFSFELIGQRTTSASPSLPPQYRNVRLALMERPS